MEQKEARLGLQAIGIFFVSVNVPCDLTIKVILLYATKTQFISQDVSISASISTFTETFTTLN